MRSVKKGNRKEGVGRLWMKSEPKQVRCHGQQNDTGGRDSDADADKIGRARAKALAKWQPKHGRYSANSAVDNLNKINAFEVQSRSRRGCRQHLSDDQIAV